MTPFAQRVFWVLLAIVCVIIGNVPWFNLTNASSWLTNLASLIVGGVLVTKPGDAPAPLVDVMEKVAASLKPPVPPPPPPEV